MVNQANSNTLKAQIQRSEEMDGDNTSDGSNSD